MAERITVNSKKPASIKENQISHKRKTDFRSNSPPVNRILYLQRTIGNQAVQRMMKSGALQAKLKIGQPGDKYEQEADRVADAVMRMPEPGVQRQVEPEEEEEEILQTKPLAEEITPLVQRQLEPEEEEEEEMLQAKSREDATSEVPNDLESQINAIRGGQPLAESERAYFEPRFGADFSQVRLHTDSQAAESARAVNARAFTVGQDVVFGVGEYAPGTAAGQRLLVHELTHVVQQAGDKVQRQRHGDRQIGVAITHSSRESIQRQVKDVKQTELANFFSMPEDALPKNLSQKYLTNPEIMKIQRKVVMALVDRVQNRQAPLTASQFLALVRRMTADDGTALLVCHNVTKALDSGESPIGWKNVSRDPLPLVYSLNGTVIRFDPNNFHEDAVKYGTRGKTVFYAMFSAAQLGTADEGDWYHYFVTATATYYAASSKLIYDKPKKGTDFTGELVRNVAEKMKDKSIKDSAAYRGWRFANAMSFLEGAGYGNTQKEVNRESRAHLQGASAGLAGVCRIPGENWKWSVPKSGSLVKVIKSSGAGGVVLPPDTVEKTLTGIKGRFRIIIVNATTPDKWYDTPDPYVEYENSFLGRLLAGGGSTSVKEDTTKPVWNEHLATLDYDVLRSVTLKMTDEDHISDDPIVQFPADLRPAGLRVKTFLLKASSSILRVRVEAEGDIVLKGG